MSDNSTSTKEERPQSPLTPATDTVWGVVAAIEAMARDGTSAGLPTGFSELDSLLGGLRPGELTLIAGRPSTGKSSLALNVANHVMIEHNASVAWFGLEDTPENLITRALVSEARVGSNRLRTGSLREEDMQRLARAAGLLSVARLWLYVAPSRRSSAVLRAMRGVVEAEGIDVVVVDSVDGISGDNDDFGREFRPNTLGTFVREAKALAIELMVPVIVTAGVSAQVERRVGGSRMPILSDLRDLGGAEQYADAILLLHRQELYDGPTDKDGNSIEGLAEIAVAKHRNGPTGWVRLFFGSEYARFGNFSLGNA